MVAHQVFSLVALAARCEVAPKRPPLFHLVVVLLFVWNPQVCPLELDIVCQVHMILVVVFCVVLQDILDCCRSKFRGCV